MLKVWAPCLSPWPYARRDLTLQRDRYVLSRMPLLSLGCCALFSDTLEGSAVVCSHTAEVLKNRTLQELEIEKRVEETVHREESPWGKQNGFPTVYKRSVHMQEQLENPVKHIALGGSFPFLGFLYLRKRWVTAFRTQTALLEQAPYLLCYQKSMWNLAYVHSVLGIVCKNVALFIFPFKRNLKDNWGEKWNKYCSFTTTNVWMQRWQFK